MRPPSIGNEPFAVLLPDDVIAAQKPCLQQMVEAYEQTGGNMVAAMEVPPSKTRSYGVLDIEEDHGSIVKCRGMVEKPKAEEAPSNLAVIGRYILTPRCAAAPQPQEGRCRRRDPADRRHRRRGKPQRRLWLPLPRPAL